MLGGWQGWETSEPATAVFCSAWSFMQNEQRTLVFQGQRITDEEAKQENNRYGYFVAVLNFPIIHGQHVLGSTVCDATHIFFAM